MAAVSFEWTRKNSWRKPLICQRPQNEQICLSQYAELYKPVQKALDLIFSEAIDLSIMYAEVHRLTLLCGRKKKKKTFLNGFPNIIQIKLPNDIHLFLSYAFFTFAKQETFMSLQRNV